MIAVGGFHAHWVSTLYLGVHVCFLCVMIFFVFTAACYSLYGFDALIKDQYMMN